MIIDARAPRGASLRDRVRKLILTAENQDDERQLSLLADAIFGGGKIVCAPAKKEEEHGA